MTGTSTADELGSSASVSSFSSSFNCDKMIGALDDENRDDGKRRGLFLVPEKKIKNEYE